MKKTLIIGVISLITLASCTKEGKLNRKLDGSWTAYSMDGQLVPSSESNTIEFDKDKNDDGKYTSINVYQGNTYTETGTYQLTKDDVIELISTNGTTKATVTDYSKTELTLTIQGNAGGVIIYKKK